MTEPRNPDVNSKPNVKEWFKKNKESKKHFELAKNFLLNHYTGDFYGFINKKGRPQYRFNSHGIGYVSITTSKVHSTVRFVLDKKNIDKRFFKSSKILKNKNGEEYNVFDFKLIDQKSLDYLKEFFSENFKLIQNFEIQDNFQREKEIFEKKVTQLLEKKLPEPKGSKNPKKRNSTVIIYERDANVKAWVLQNSKGTCESCGSNKHFEAESGIAFLEVHHLKRLSDGGSDTPSNVVAICPNCHRELHLGLHREKKKEILYASLKRLKSE